MKYTYYQDDDDGIIIRFNGASNFEIWLVREKRW